MGLLMIVLTFTVFTHTIACLLPVLAYTRLDGKCCVHEVVQETCLNLGRVRCASLTYLCLT